MPRRGRSYGGHSIIGGRRWGKSHGPMWPIALRAMILTLIIVISTATTSWATEKIFGEPTVSPGSSSALMSASQEVPFPKVTDFQFSKICLDSPIFILAGANIPGKTVSWTDAENSIGDKTLKGKVSVKGKADVYLWLTWDPQNLWVRLKDVNGLDLITYESLSYDPRGKFLAVGFDNLDEMLVFDVPRQEGLQVGYALMKRSEIVEQNSSCP